MMTRFMVLALGSLLPAWAGWIIAKDLGALEGFLAANVCFACGWYLSRKFVRDHLNF